MYLLRGLCSSSKWQLLNSIRHIFHRNITDCTKRRRPVLLVWLRLRQYPSPLESLRICFRCSDNGIHSFRSCSILFRLLYLGAQWQEVVVMCNYLCGESIIKFYRCIRLISFVVLFPRHHSIICWGYLCKPVGPTKPSSWLTIAGKRIQEVYKRPVVEDHCIGGASMFIYTPS